jgi:glycolate oxidase
LNTSDDLRAILGADRVDDSVVAQEAYSRDATPEFHQRPGVVVFPRSTEEVTEVVKYARQVGTPVVPRGAGSNLCASTVPPSGAIVLSLTRMNKIIEVSRGELLAVVQPGVTTATLDQRVAAEGLLFPPDPGSRTVSTIGGNIATCAGGLRGLKYGVTRNYVLGLEVVIGTGEVIRTGGRLVKDVAGYDLTRLLTGSEGTLGVITEAIVSLRARPLCSRYGVAYFKSLEAASQAVEAIILTGLLPATLEFLDRTCISSVEDFAQLGLNRSAGALLLFGDDGDEETAERHTEQMANICQGISGCLDVTLAKSVAESEALLEARRCSLPSLARLGTLCILEDICVARPQLANAVAGIAEIANRHNVLIGTFGHAGDGNLHPTVVVDQDDEYAVAAAHRALDEIFTLALDLGGTITGEHGVGLAKLKYLERQLGSEQLSLLRRVKRAFDPDGILNPGKLGS